MVIGALARAYQCQFVSPVIEGVQDSHFGSAAGRRVTSFVIYELAFLAIERGQGRVIYFVLVFWV